MAKAIAEIVLEMSPYLLAGLLIAGILNRYVPREKVQKIASPGFKGPVLSSLFGIPLPLCSCSVLPFAAQMRKSGGSKGATLAFLTSTPQTGIDSILVAYSFFGLPFALFKAGAAFITGTVGGWISELFLDKKNPDINVEEEEKTCSCGDHCHEKKPSILHYAFIELMGDFSKSIFFGIIAAGLINALVPDELFAKMPVEWLFYPAVLGLSIPFYICATSSIPLAFAFAAKGMPVGAAIVFLIAGPATNTATIGLVAKTLGRKHTILYIVNIALFSIAAGLLFDYLGIGLIPSEKVFSPFHLPFGVEVISALIFGFLCFFHLIKGTSRLFFARPKKKR